MTKQVINIGSGEFAGDGESLRNAFDKINTNFTELYGNLQNAIPNVTSQSGKYLSTNGTDLIWVSLPPSNQLVNGDKIVSLDSNGNLGIPAGGTISVGGEPYAPTIFVGLNPPVYTDEGKLWYDIDGGRMYVFYSNTWVDANPRGTISLIAQGSKASNAIGTPGEIYYDANWVYVCVATNTWKRAPLSGGY